MSLDSNPDSAARAELTEQKSSVKAMLIIFFILFYVVIGIRSKYYEPQFKYLFAESKKTGKVKLFAG